MNLTYLKINVCTKFLPDVIWHRWDLWLKHWQILNSTIAGKTLWWLIGTFKLFKSLASTRVNTIKASFKFSRALTKLFTDTQGRYTIQFSWLQQWRFLSPSITCHRNIIMPHSNYIWTAAAEDLYEKTMLHRLEMQWAETSWNSYLDFIKLFINRFTTTTSNYTYPLAMFYINFQKKCIDCILTKLQHCQRWCVNIYLFV